MVKGEKKSIWDKIVIATNKAKNSQFVANWTASINNMVHYTWSFGKLAGMVTWFALSALCITVVPLFLEIDREQGSIEAEKRQIEKLRQRGYTSQQINMLQAQSTIPM